MSDLSPHQLDALERIEKKPPLQQPFFQKIDGLKWFDELKKRRFFDPALNPKPMQSEKDSYFIVPAWPILAYVEKIAPKFAHHEHRRYAEEYLNVIREVTTYAIDNGYSNYRTWWHFSKTLALLPIELLIESDATLISHWLNDPFERSLVATEIGLKLLPALLASNAAHAPTIALVLMKTLSSVRWDHKKGGRDEDREPALLVDNYHAKKIFEETARKFGSELEREGVEVFRSRLLEVLLVTGRDKYSTIWRPAIEEHSQNKALSEPFDILIDAFRDALEGYVDRRAAATIPYLEEMLVGDVVLQRRIAIYIIGTYGGALGRLVSQVIIPQNFSNHYRHEVYHFIQNCFSLFDNQTRERLLSIIDDLGRQVEQMDGELNLVRGARERLSWLSAVKDCGDRRVEELVNQYVGMIGALPEHPDFSSYSGEAQEVGEISPYSTQELLSRDVGDLVNILSSFREEGTWKAPTRRGLARELRSALALKPDYFERHLQELLFVDFDYVYELLAGYGDLWTEKGYDNWAELLEFCSSLLQRPGFWESDEAPRQSGLRANHSWVVTQVADLIKAGTSNDKTAFDPSLLPQAKSLIECILEHQSYESFVETADPVAIAINSARGRTIEALVNYALRCCRLADKSVGDHASVWLSDLREMFDKEMQSAKTGNYEFVTLFVKYIPNLIYINREWTIQRLPEIFDKTNRKKWLCAINGYGYNNVVYESIYTFLREQSDLRSALDEETLEPSIKNKIIQNIVVAYLQGYEDIGQEGGLMPWLLGRQNVDELGQLIWFVWTLRSKDAQALTEKILVLWKEISDRADPASEQGKAVLSRLAMWSVFIQVLDRNAMRLLEKLAPFADQEHNAYILVEQLRRLVDVHPQEVAQIYLAMMAGCAPTYQQEDVEYILTKLFQCGAPVRSRVNEIVDSYVSRAIEFPALIKAKHA